MAGFLDSKERIIDMVLTGKGKELLAGGNLRFVHWSAFDDEVDYDPFVAESGSLSADGLVQKRSQLTESPLVRECSAGYMKGNPLAWDSINVNRPIYTLMPGGGTPAVSPLSFMTVTTGSDVSVMQFLPEDGDKVVRTGMTSKTVDVGYTEGAYEENAVLEGAVFSVFLSSSDGYKELLMRTDSDGDSVFGNVLKAEISK